MRIIIFTSSLTPSGGARQAIYQAAGLAHAGHDVTFCIPRNSTIWKLPNESFWAPLPEDRKQWRSAIEQHLPATGPAIVHAFHNKAVKLAAWWGLFWRSRGVVCCAHRGVIYRPGSPLPYWSPGMAAFIVNSQACARAIAWHAPTSKVHVVYNGVPDTRVTPSKNPAEVRASLGVAADTFLFGCVGHNGEVKGIDVLIDAFAAANPANAHLVLAGATEDHWGTRCRTLGIAHKVHLLGHTEAVSDYLQAFDAFILPSRSESLPNTLLEAIRMGLPVIGSNVGGVPELIDGNGLLVPPADVPALAAALTRMHADAPARTAWAARSRELGPRYTIGARVAALVEVYTRLLHAKGLA